MLHIRSNRITALLNAAGTLLLCCISACSSGGGSSGNAQAAPTLDVSGFWSGSYNTTSSIGSISFEITQAGTQVGGTCHLVNKVYGRTVDFTLTGGTVSSTGFTFAMREDAPLIGQFTGTARMSGSSGLQVNFSGQDSTGPISVGAYLTSERGAGAWIGMWQSPGLPLVAFALRLEQSGQNLAGRMTTFQSAIGLPMVFEAGGSIDGTLIHLTLIQSPLIPVQPPGELTLVGSLNGDNLDIEWLGNDGYVQHAGGTGAAYRATPFHSSSGSSTGIYAGMIGSTEWTGFAVVDYVEYLNINRVGATVTTVRGGSPFQLFGIGYAGYHTAVQLESTTQGCFGLWNMTFDFDYGATRLEATFSGNDCAGLVTNGSWSPIRI
jgi:hypothetical protein